MYVIRIVENVFRSRLREKERGGFCGFQVTHVLL